MDGRLGGMRALHMYNSTTQIQVDDNDYQWLKQYNWSPHYGKNKVYARTWVNGTRRFMHQLILPSDDPNLSVDHVNGNGLDNRRENLRLATRSQQRINTYKCGMSNSSFHKGVSYRTDSKKWRARLKVNGELIDLGTFKTEDEAAQAYNIAVVKYFEKFAVINT